MSSGLEYRSIVAEEIKLEEWIQPEHLSRNAIQQCRHAFWSHPLRVTVLKQFLLDEAADRLSRFLSREAVFKRIYGLYSSANRDGNISDVAEEEWLAVEESRRFYRFGDYDSVRDEFRSSSNFAAFQDFAALTRSQTFRKYAERITGLAFGDTVLLNAYSYEAGDFLSLHSDNVKEKRLSFVFYLTPQWESRFGGGLEIMGFEGGHLEIEPEYNSLAIFDVAARTEHHITPVDASAGTLARLTISGWLLKRDSA